MPGNDPKTGLLVNKWDKIGRKLSMITGKPWKHYCKWKSQQTLNVRKFIQLNRKRQDIAEWNDQTSNTYTESTRHARRRNKTKRRTETKFSRCLAKLRPAEHLLDHVYIISEKSNKQNGPPILAVCARRRGRCELAINSNDGVNAGMDVETVARIYDVKRSAQRWSKY